MIMVQGRKSPGLIFYRHTAPCHRGPSFVHSFYPRFSSFRIYRHTTLHRCSPSYRNDTGPYIPSPNNATSSTLASNGVPCIYSQIPIPIESWITEDASLSFITSFTSASAAAAANCSHSHIRKSTVRHNCGFLPICALSPYIRNTATQRAVSSGPCSRSLYIQATTAASRPSVPHHCIYELPPHKSVFHGLYFRSLYIRAAYADIHGHTVTPIRHCHSASRIVAPAIIWSLAYQLHPPCMPVPYMPYTVYTRVYTRIHTFHPEQSVLVPFSFHSSFRVYTAIYSTSCRSPLPVCLPACPVFFPSFSSCSFAPYIRLYTHIARVSLHCGSFSPYIRISISACVFAFSVFLLQSFSHTYICP